MAKKKPRREEIPPCFASMGCLCAGHACGSPASAPCDPTERPAPHEADARLQILFDCAKNHGEESEPDHEVGDLQAALMFAWAELTPARRVKVMQQARESGLLDWEPATAREG